MFCFAGFMVGFGDPVGLSLGFLDQVYLLHNFANCSLTGNGDLPKLADLFLIPQCLIHTYSAVIRIFFVFIMNFQHGVSKRLILPCGVLTFKITVKCLPADLQRVAVKADLSGVLPSSVRYAIYFNRCSFRTSDSRQRKKLLVFFGDIQRVFRASFSAADIKVSYPCFSDPAVQRVYRYLKFICCIYRTYLFCKLYRLHLVLIFILFIF